MRYQDQVVKITQKALDDVCRAARGVPVDRIDWCPGALSRSTLDQMQEIATAAGYFVPLLTEFHAPEFDEAARAEARRRRSALDTLDKCVAEARSGTASLCQIIGSFRDEDLDVEVVLPFGGGVTMTMADVLHTPAWNMIYHLGQINQIQLLLGDPEMH